MFSFGLFKLSTTSSVVLIFESNMCNFLPDNITRHESERTKHRLISFTVGFRTKSLFTPLLDLRTIQSLNKKYKCSPKTTVSLMLPYPVGTFHLFTWLVSLISNCYSISSIISNDNRSFTKERNIIWRIPSLLIRAWNGFNKFKLLHKSDFLWNYLPC